MKFFIFLALVAVASAMPYGGHYEEEKDFYGKHDKYDVYQKDHYGHFEKIWSMFAIMT